MSQFYDTIDGMNFLYPGSTSMAFFLQCDFYLLDLLTAFSVTSASYVLEMPVSMVKSDYCWSKEISETEVDITEDS